MDPKNLLEDKIYSLERIEHVTKGMRQEGFADDINAQDVVIRRFAVIGEAANKLPKELKEKHPEVEWKDIIKMRNFLLHEYFDIDVRIVWDTIKEDLPRLKTKIAKILDKQGSE